MEVVEDSSERFHLASQPSIFSQAVFIGFFAFGFTLSFYSESLFWQLLYILGSFVIATSFLGQWQKLVIDKASRRLHYEVQNIYQKLFAVNRYLVSENLSLDDLRQVKCNPINGTIGFYHNLTTISVYVGNPCKCEAMLAKIKSHLPSSSVSCREVWASTEILEDLSEESEGTATAADAPAPTSKENAQREAEAGDLPETSSFDSLKVIGDNDDDEEGLSSDESFVKIDDKEFDESGDPSTDDAQAKSEHEDVASEEPRVEGGAEQ